MRALLIYPQNPETFWSFKHALKFISKKALHPPLGLVTVAAMLPASWEKKLIDENVEPLKDKHLQWADYVFISAMAIQRKSVKRVVDRCRAMGVKVVAGGPLFTTRPPGVRAGLTTLCWARPRSPCLRFPAATWRPAQARAHLRHRTSIPKLARHPHRLYVEPAEASSATLP